jgi:hypothetical protein
VHTRLAVTTGGPLLGPVGVKFWTRKVFQVTNARRGKVDATRVPITRLKLMALRGSHLDAYADGQV